MRTWAWVVVGIALVLGGCRSGRRGWVPEPRVQEGKRVTACDTYCSIVSADWPCHWCAYAAYSDTAKCKLLYIIISAVGAPEGSYRATAGELAQDCLDDDGLIENGLDHSCGTVGQSCCRCVSEAHWHATRGEWQQCAAKLGHGHGGGQNPP
jgi:hypothetical protein